MHVNEGIYYSQYMVEINTYMLIVGIIIDTYIITESMQVNLIIMIRYIKRFILSLIVL